MEVARQSRHASAASTSPGVLVHGLCTWSFVCVARAVCDVKMKSQKCPSKKPNFLKGSEKKATTFELRGNIVDTPLRSSHTSTSRRMPCRSGVLALLVFCTAGMLDGVQGQSRPGGISNAVSPSQHDTFEAAAKVAVDHLNARSNAVPEYTLGRVVSVRTQVVAGT